VCAVLQLFAFAAVDNVVAACRIEITISCTSFLRPLSSSSAALLVLGALALVDLMAVFSSSSSFSFKRSLTVWYRVET